MVTIDEMWLIGGSPIVCAPGVMVRQPTLGDIRKSDVGFHKYITYVNTFALKLSDMVQEEALSKMQQELGDALSVYFLFSFDPALRAAMLEALRFFLVGDVQFDETMFCFSVDGIPIGDDMYDTIRRCILICSGAKDIEAVAPKFKNEKARKMYEKIQKGRAEMAAAKAAGGNNDTTLPNLISALCAKHPSINLCNVWDLTVWQLYDQFGRVCVNSQIDIVGLRWAAWGKDEFDFSTWYKNNSK